MQGMTNAQARIIGYLISVQGSDQSGSTIDEIVAGTGLGRNTVYTHLRHGTPGVIKCSYLARNGATQYYVTKQSIVDSGVNNLPGEVTTKTILEAEEYNNGNPLRTDIRNSIKLTVDKTPASVERINELLEAVQHSDRMENFVVAGQAIALIALELLGDKAVVE